MRSSLDHMQCVTYYDSHSVPAPWGSESVSYSVFFKKKAVDSTLALYRTFQC